MSHLKLSPEDQARVDHVLNDRVNSVTRKPFRPWFMMGFLVVVLLAFGGLSYWIAWSEGVV